MSRHVLNQNQRYTKSINYLAYAILHNDPNCFDLCVQDRRSQLPAPDSSKKLSSLGSTQDSSQVSLRSVLTSAFRTGDPSYLPQTPPRSSLLRDRPKAPPRRLPECFDLCVQDRRSQLPAPDSS
ncbi:uncharacterized protein ACIBXB_018850, partial [Morphnus guianensis]